MRQIVTRILAKIPPALWASLGLHAAAVAALFLVPGLMSPAPPEVQTARILAEPEAAPPLAELPPPAPVQPQPQEPPPPADPDRREEPPDEPPLDDATPLPLAADDPPPVPDHPVRRPEPPERAIALRPPAPAPVAPPPVASPAPPPAPRRTTPEPERHLNRKPEYPAQAVEREWEGRVLLLVEVLPDGTVASVSVRESSGYAILDRAAEAAVRDWIFRPATVQGQPVRSWVEVPINFKLTE